MNGGVSELVMAMGLITKWNDRRKKVSAGGRNGSLNFEGQS